MKTLASFYLIISFFSIFAQEDIKGAKDHPLFPRQPDYFISQYQVVDNDTTETFFYPGGRSITGAVHKTVITYQIKAGATAVSSSFILSNFQANIKRLKPKIENGEYANIVTASTDTWVHLKSFVGKGNKQKSERYVLIIGENPRVAGRIPGAPSKFAGSYRSLIGKRFDDIKELTLLNSLNFADQWDIGAGTENDFNGHLAVSWYAKGNLMVALYTSKVYVEDVNKVLTIVLDVLEINNVQKNQTLTIGVCQDAGKTMPTLAALVLPAENAQSYPAIKAWYFNPGTFQIDAWPADKVKCLPTGQD